MMELKLKPKPLIVGPMVLAKGPHCPSEEETLEWIT